jgi:nitroreductase
LALQARGIGSCAQASLRSYANLIKSELGIPDELRVLCGVSFGYPVPDAPANRVHQARAPLSDNVVCLGFAEPL